MLTSPERRSATAIDHHISARLRAARIAAGISQTDAGGLLGVTFQQVQKYERGSNRISAGKMAMLADLYGVSIPWLFQGAPIGQAEKCRDLAAEMLGSPHGSEVAESFVAIKSRDDMAMVARFAKILSEAS